MKGCSGWLSRGLHPLSGLLVFCLLGWMPAAWATQIDCLPKTDFYLPSFGTIIVPPNAPPGSSIGPQEQVTISFKCTNLPTNTTVSIVGSNLGAPDNNYAAPNANSIMLLTSVAGVDLELTTSPLPTNYANNTVTFAGTMSPSNDTFAVTVIGRLIKTGAGSVTGPLQGNGPLIGTFTAEPNNGNGNNGVVLGNALFLQSSTIISASACTGLVVPTPVVLPTVSVSALASGQTAGTTAFGITLTGCPSGVTRVGAYFEPGATIDSTTGNLKNQGSAANIEVQLLNGNGGTASAGSAINLGAPDTAQNSAQYPITNGVATMNYYARYVANGATASAGSVQTSVKFTLEYP